MASLPAWAGRFETMRSKRGSLLEQCPRTVAETNRCVVQPVACDVFRGCLDGADVAIDEIDMSVGPLRGEGEGRWLRSRSRGRGPRFRGRGQRRQLVEQQFRAFIKRAGGEQAVARTQDQLAVSGIDADMGLSCQPIAQRREMVWLSRRLVHGSSIRADTGVNLSMCSGSMRRTMPG